MAKEPDITQTDLLLQIAQTLKAVQENAQGGGAIAATLDKITETLAGVANRARPENPEPNGISAFSNPKGDYVEPKPPLKCPMTWVGYPLETESLTPAEVAAVNKLEPGEYFVTKGNGNQIPFRVEAKRNLTGGIEKLEITFPCKGEQSADHRSMLAYCREAVGEKMPTADDLMAQITELRAKLANAEAVIEAA